ncbi:MAG: hypothetical protein ACXWQO_13165 [Bdellovibrionota bacterium]
MIRTLGTIFTLGFYVTAVSGCAANSPSSSQRIPSSVVAAGVPYDCSSDEARLKASFTTGTPGVDLTFLSDNETIQTKCDNAVGKGVGDDERLYRLQGEYLYNQQICEGQSRKGGFVLTFGPTPKSEMKMLIRLRKAHGPDLNATLECKISGSYKGW